MKKIDWFILIIVIIVIVAIGIWAFMPSDEAHKKEDEKKTRMEALGNRLKAIQEQINNEIDSLRLTTEIEHFLDRKIGRLFLIAKLIFVALVCGVFWLFVATGSDFLSALANTTCIVGVALAVIPFLFLSKVLDVNTLIESVKSRIKRWIYAKYGYSPGASNFFRQSLAPNGTTRPINFDF